MKRLKIFLKLSGSVTKAEPIEPINEVAIFEPLWGVSKKNTVASSNIGLKTKMSFNEESCFKSISSYLSVKVTFHSLSWELVERVLEITPPMLWPIMTALEYNSGAPKSLINSLSCFLIRIALKNGGGPEG